MAAAASMLRPRDLHEINTALAQRCSSGSRACALTHVPKSLLSIVAQTLQTRKILMFDTLPHWDRTSARPVRIVAATRNASDAALALPDDASSHGEACDLLLLAMDRGTVESRQGLLMGLPSLLRLVGSPRNAIVAMGPNCSSTRHLPKRYVVGGACMRRVDPSTPKPAAALRSGNMERYPCDAAEMCWLERWRELHDEREMLRDGSCRQLGAAGEHVLCIAGINTEPSLCDRGTPLLGGLSAMPVRWQPQHSAAWRSNTPRMRVVLRMLQNQLRYLTVLPCGRRICLAFKNALFEIFVATISSDDGLLFDTPPQLAVPRDWPVGLVSDARGRHVLEYARTTHNLAITYHNGSYLLAGGRFRPKTAKAQRAERGIWMEARAALPYTERAHLMPGTRLRINPNSRHGISLERVRESSSSRETGLRADGAPPINGGSPEPRIVISGSHAGCVERRTHEALQWVGVPPGACEFDGRLSLSHFKGRLWLFVRANLASSGQRFVQVSSSANGAEWSPFQLISLNGYQPAHGDIYYFAAQQNPVDASSMLAVFPLVHRARACIGLAFSTDALRWSSPRALLPCRAAGERAVDQPAAGMLRRDGHVLLYVHENVPGIRVDARTPEVHRKRLRQLHGAMEPRIVRYDIPVAWLQRWTEEGLRSL